MPTRAVLGQKANALLPCPGPPAEWTCSRKTAAKQSPCSTAERFFAAAWSAPGSPRSPGRTGLCGQLSTASAPASSRVRPRHIQTGTPPW